MPKIVFNVETKFWFITVKKGLQYFGSALFQSHTHVIKIEASGQLIYRG